MLLLLATNADDAYDNCDALDGVAGRQLTTCRMALNDVDILSANFVKLLFIAIFSN